MGVILFFTTKDNTTPNNNPNIYKKQIDSLSNVIFKHQQENIILNKKFKYYDSLSNVYSLEIDSLTLNINKRRKFYDKQIKNLNNLSPTELYKFITDRYK